jgi:hypothetical protein
MAEWFVSFVAGQVATKIAKKYYNEYIFEEKTNEDIYKELNRLTLELKETRMKLDLQTGSNEKISVFPLPEKKQQLLVEAIVTPILPEYIIYNKNTIVKFENSSKLFN